MRTLFALFSRTEVEIGPSAACLNRVRWRRKLTQGGADAVDVKSNVASWPSGALAYRGPLPCTHLEPPSERAETAMAAGVHAFLGRTGRSGRHRLPTRAGPLHDNISPLGAAPSCRGGRENWTSTAAAPSCILQTRGLINCIAVRFRDAWDWKPLLPRRSSVGQLSLRGGKGTKRKEKGRIVKSES